LQISCSSHSASRSAFAPPSRRRSCSNWSTPSRGTTTWWGRSASSWPRGSAWRNPGEMGPPPGSP